MAGTSVQLALDDALQGQTGPEAASLPAQDTQLSPMLQEYRNYKLKRPEVLLFFQVGDFFELFFDDAVVVAGELNLTLTSRDKNSPNPVPMCGVPVASVEGYLLRLVDGGYSCAVVEQTGERTDTGAFARELSRIITPACRLLAGESAAQLTVLGAYAVVVGEDYGTLAWFDSDGTDVFVHERLSAEQVQGELARLGIDELILSGDGENFHASTRLVRELKQLLGERAVHRRAGAEFSRYTLQACSPVGFEQLSASGKVAVRSLFAFLDDTQVKAQELMRRVAFEEKDTTLRVDAVSARNLELFRTLRTNTAQGSLFAHLNRCISPSGKKTLERWLRRPLRDRAEIERRYDSIEFIVAHPRWEKCARQKLHSQSDLSRLASRLQVGVLSIRDMHALTSSLLQLQELFKHEDTAKLPLSVTWKESDFEKCCDVLLDAFGAVLSESASSPYRRIFRAGYDDELDRLFNLRSSGAEWLTAYERQLRETSGIGSLKVRHNNVLGYFIEVTKVNVARVPEFFQQRQTMVNAVRYVSEELKEKESELINAGEKFQTREAELLAQMRLTLKPFSALLREVSEFSGALDVLIAFADCARRKQYVRPELTSRAESIFEDLRHPILDEALGRECIPNSIAIGAAHTGELIEGPQPMIPSCILLTGPNMGGKSTYLRQVALAQIMTQIGSFVPATRAQVGFVDQIFARLGASDDLSEGDSTFMVEMRETAYMLSHATQRSLVLVDEIGRGTATQDGYAIATAVLECLATDLRCRSLFATHFHELTVLTACLPTVENFHVSVSEADDDIVFTHHIEPGAAHRSYGLEVAALAGLPEAVLQKAREVFADQEIAGTTSVVREGASMRGVSAPDVTTHNNPPSVVPHEVARFLGRIASLRVDELRPVDALVELEKCVVEAEKLRSAKEER